MSRCTAFGVTWFRSTNARAGPASHSCNSGRMSQNLRLQETHSIIRWLAEHVTYVERIKKAYLA